MRNFWGMSAAPAPLAPCVPAEPRCLSTGLPPAAARGQDPGARGGDQAHHPQGQEPPAAAVGAARLRVRPQHPGQRAAGARPALQQLQRAVPEHLRECLPAPRPCAHPHPPLSPGLSQLSRARLPPTPAELFSSPPTASANPASPAKLTTPLPAGVALSWSPEGLGASHGAAKHCLWA